MAGAAEERDAAEGARRGQRAGACTCRRATIVGANGEKRTMNIAEAAAAGGAGQGGRARGARAALRTSYGDTAAAYSASVVAATDRCDEIAVRSAWAHRVTSRARCCAL